MIMTATRTTSGYSFTPWADQGLSEEAKMLRAHAKEASDFTTSVAVGEPVRSVQEALYEIFAAAQIDDWDGEGSVRAEFSTYVYANLFLRLLPSATPIPDISVDVDGEIFFEWDLGPRRVFSVSIGRDGTLNYAALIGHESIHNAEAFQEPLSPAILSCLSRLLTSSES